MTTAIYTAKKSIGILFIGAMFFVAFSPFASAQTYYYPTYQTQTQRTAQIQSLLSQVYALVAQLQAIAGTGVTYTYTQPIQSQYVFGQRISGSYDVDVDTDDADENDDTATLSGRVDLDSANYAHVWFEYGEDGRLTEESRSLRVTSDRSFNIKIYDLDEDERYYYRAVAEDPAGYRTYGSIDSFTTGDRRSDRYDKPDVRTDDAENIQDDSAKLHGRVDMNDFDNGTVFFVYGEDEDDVEDVEDEDTYSAIDERGDDLQKVKVYTNLDDNRTVWYTVSGLDDNTDHYFRLCVEYEDEDNDDTLECGDVEDFETD